MSGGKGQAETATLAGGGFWCTEAIFRRLKGVSEVTSGYANSLVENPTWEEVYSERTEAAEAVRIKFDPKIISYRQLLEVFFKLHDPMSLNRQGADAGTEYRSAIFYHDEEQEKAARGAKSKVTGAVTEVVPLKNFYRAEGYHRDYYENNKTASYCRLVIDPKISKLYKEFEGMTA